jgi:hypothetical protein
MTAGFHNQIGEIAKEMSGSCIDPASNARG